MTQGFAVVGAKVGEPGQVAIIRNFANVDFVEYGDISTIDETIVRALVGFVVDGRGLSRRSWTTEQRFQRNCRSDSGDGGSAFYKLSSAYSRFLDL